MKLKELLGLCVSERGWPVTVSVGLVTFLEPPGSIEEIIREADRLMYQVKRETRDAVRHEVRSAAGG